jgi:hypothetical protein
VAWNDGPWRNLAEQVGAESWRKPERGSMPGAGGRLSFAAPVLAYDAPLCKPLAAVFVAEHIRGWLDAHATKRASRGPQDR